MKLLLFLALFGMLAVAECQEKSGPLNWAMAKTGKKSNVIFKNPYFLLALALDNIM